MTRRAFLALATLPLLAGCWSEAEYAAYERQRIRREQIELYGHPLPDFPPIDTSRMTFEQRMQALALLNAMRGPQASPPMTTTTCRPWAGTLQCDSY